MSTEALGAVLPLKLRGGYHSENLARCQILFSSLIAFAEPDLLEEIHVVTPPDDCEDARRLCTEWPSLPLRVFDERDYLPVLRRRWFARGMFIQQLIKLTAANRLDTPFFLTLDPDVILCKPLRKSDLFVGGRALLDPEPRRARPDWWTGSAGVLGIPVDLQADGMMLTPALLSRTVLTISQPAGEDGRLFGSVTAQDVVEAIRQARDLKLDRRRVHLENPIRTTGTHMVTIEVAEGVTASVKTIVTAE